MTDKRAGAAGQNAAGLERDFTAGSGKDVGNRPANNAHLATPAAARAHAQSWQAQNGAGDFLGLDQELSGQAAQAAMIAPPPVATVQAPVPAGFADESWLMEMTETPSEPVAAARVPREVPPSIEEAPLLNASWREPGKPARRRSLVAPLVACGVIGVLALVGWPMLQRKSTATQDDAGQDLAKASVPVHAWDRPGAATPAAHVAAEPDRSGVASVAPAREEAPTLPDGVEPVVKPIPPPANTGREVADARIEVAAPNEQPSSVEGLVEVVPLARVNTPPSSPSTTSAHSKPTSDVSWGVPADDDNGLDASSSADDVVSADDTSVPPEFVNPLAEPYEPPKTTVVAAPPKPVKPAPAVVVAPPQPVKPAPEVVIAPAQPSKPAPEVVVAPPQPSKPAPEVAIAPPPPVKPAVEVVAAAKPSPAPVASELHPTSSSAISPPVTSPAKVDVVASAHDPVPVVAKPTPQPPAPQPAAASSVADAGAQHESAVAQPAPAVATFVGPTAAGASEAPKFDQASTFGPVPASSGSEWIALNDPAPNPSARTVQLAVEDVLLLSDGGSSLHQASVKELSGVWTQTTVPLESIGAPTKVLTPSVGKVRVVLTSGEMFEGGLYAVGEGSVWIDTQYGRMGLSGPRVKSVVQIDAPKGTPALGAPGSQALGGLEHVRIKTPGGVFVGKVIDRDAKKTTLLTDDGSRVTFDTKDVEVLNQAPTVTIKKK